MPLLAQRVGEFTVLVDLTEAREPESYICLPTYVSWAAWYALGFRPLESRGPLELLECYKEAVASSPPAVELPIRYSDGTLLKAVFGPNTNYGCVVLMLALEQAWLRPRFPLGRVELSEEAREHLFPEFVNAALARHVAGDDGGEKSFRDRNEAAERAGDAIVSHYNHPSVGDVNFWLKTVADRSLTKVWLDWSDEPNS